ncbi:MAG: site-specific tyrosine recombinase/integron integrase [Candidatus Paceibacterota bacterium]
MAISELDKLKTEFLEYIEIEKGRSVKTVQNYDHYLTKFFNYGNVKKATDITERGVRDFRLWLNRQPGARSGKETMKKTTQNYYLISLRSFLKFLAKRGVKSLAPEKIELAKTGERQLELLTEAELRRLLKAPDGGDEKSLRDKAILELLFSTGLRVAELCSLNRDHFESGRDEFSVRGKGDKVRLVFISETAKEVVNNYLKKRGDVEEALFVSLPGKKKHSSPTRLTPRSIERVVRHYATYCGIGGKVTPHVIRHSFATDLLRNGADIRSVQIMLGHANVATTQIYTHVTNEQLRSVHKQFHNKKKDN